IYLKSKASSLKYYLEKCGLGSKMDMPMTTMNKRYEDAILYLSDTLAKNIYEVANYCVIDALQCQELIVKHNVINDYREVSSIAYMSLSDSHYFAGGSKWGNIPVERFVLQMKAKHALEVIENKWLIKRALERKKKSKKVNNLDNDEIANVKDEESQKLAKKWLKNYIKNLCDDNDYLNMLDKIADSIRLKLSNLLSELSKLNVEYRIGLYKLIIQKQKCKTDVTILEECIFRYNLESECKALTDF
ncbi:8083_t:CDS:2, partial [Gigaspora rosea]